MTQVYKPLPPVEELWERYDYKPLTGELVHKKTKGRAIAGAPIGAECGRGYKQAGLKGELYLVHRLVYAWCGHEVTTDKTIDHINRNTRDNRVWNLRRVEQIVNSSNQLGRGYTYTKRGKYLARHNFEGKTVQLGYFDTPEEARAAYLAAKQGVGVQFLEK